ncbi:polyphosphate glucokinase [Arcanobacterium pluranimalium]|uniref:ROK family protein n=1 Tax=Arcanobacterium pluranimalium TaxID=108028 RepID=UPI00195D83E3|nr:ROK family protein [Arcanobacterium pluranimalium]MBM7824968.1 polyphosphate glucokinase [Arcanobacterium pluranimalium]
MGKALHSHDERSKKPPILTTTNDTILAAKSSDSAGDIHTLCVDCGGGGIKTTVVNSQGETTTLPVRTAVAYPFTPQDLVAILREQITTLGNPDFQRITVGLPGVIRAGIVVFTPHYIRERGPHSRADAKLAQAWNGLDAEALFVNEFGVPALVVNDAEVAACAVIRGYGCELVLTLGTGLGCAFFVNGTLVPHIEMSHAPFLGSTFDEVLGEHAREFLSDEQWSDRVYDAVMALWPVFRWERAYIGGGNAARITAEVREKLNVSKNEIFGPPAQTVAFIDNSAGLMGGNAAWELLTPSSEISSVS